MQGQIHATAISSSNSSHHHQPRASAAAVAAAGWVVVIVMVVVSGTCLGYGNRSSRHGYLVPVFLKDVHVCIELD